MDEINNILKLINDTRTHVIENTVTDQTHVLVSLEWLHELLNDVECMANGDLEYELEDEVI